MFAKVRSGVAVWTACLSLLSAPSLARAQPAQAPPTRAGFVSDTSDPWDVFVDGQHACATPCSLQLSPWQFVSLRTQEHRPVVLDVGRLPPGDLMVTGNHLHQGMYAGGIVATTFGGMALAIGITFTAVGLAKDKDGMTTAGLITGGAGAFLVPFGIYLMMKAVPSVTIGKAAPYVSANGVGIAGTF